jgi:hypothetical protein
MCYHYITLIIVRGISAPVAGAEIVSTYNRFTINSDGLNVTNNRSSI